MSMLLSSEWISAEGGAALTTDEPEPGWQYTVLVGERERGRAWLSHIFESTHHTQCKRSLNDTAGGSLCSRVRCGRAAMAEERTVHLNTRTRSFPTILHRNLSDDAQQISAASRNAQLTTHRSSSKRPLPGGCHPIHAPKTETCASRTTSSALPLESWQRPYNVLREMPS